MRSIFLISRALSARKRKIFALFFALAASVGISWGATVNSLPGKFSVADGTVVCFSQGNLQYQASTDTWRFATNQYDLIGSDNSNISASYTGWIDLFGWGTGSNPTQASTSSSDYSTFTDWGVNAISNGGNTANTWRTLTKDEWVYLFYTRTNAATLFGLGSVNGVNGTILLPDDWTLPEGASFTASTTQGLADQDGYYYNSNGNNFSHNTYTAEQWSVMESAGAVFLPAAGYRFGTDVYYVGSNGYYWSASPDGTNYAYFLYFNSGSLNPQYNGGRSRGQSVRLVTETAPAAEVYTITYDANGGTDAPAAQEKTADVDLTLTEAVPTRAGYTFNGWNTAADGTGTAYAKGATYSANESITLYAQWTLDPNTPVHYVDSLGEPVANEVVAFNRPEAPEVEGFTFVRWEVLPGALKDGFKLQAVYQPASSTLNAPAKVKVGKFTLVRKDETNEYILSNHD